MSRKRPHYGAGTHVSQSFQSYKLFFILLVLVAFRVCYLGLFQKKYFNFNYYFYCIMGLKIYSGIIGAFWINRPGSTSPLFHSEYSCVSRNFLVPGKIVYRLDRTSRPDGGLLLLLIHRCLLVIDFPNNDTGSEIMGVKNFHGTFPLIS